MCGIYGKLSSHQIDASIAETATDRLVHAVLTSGRTALQLAQCKNDRGLSAAKRVFDVSAAAAALVILAPLFAALALVVRLVIGKPILFKQRRPGLHGRPFTIYKSRTMSDARDATGRFLPDAERLDWFGRFLRSTSLDELPELINVLRSEMSLVGPRPLLMEYLPRYSAEQMRRHDVLPGHYWIRANQRAQRGKLAAQVRVGCLVRGSLVEVAGPENYRGSSVKGPPTRRNQFIAPRLVRTVHGQRRGRTEQCTYD